MIKCRYVRFICECLEAKTMQRRLRDWAVDFVDTAFQHLFSTHRDCMVVMVSKIDYSIFVIIYNLKRHFAG
jgi:hypothetical protein